MARKNVQKTTFDSTLASQKTGKTIEKPLKELPWNQQCTSRMRSLPQLRNYKYVMILYSEHFSVN